MTDTGISRAFVFVCRRFSKVFFFENIFHKHYHKIQRFGFRSGVSPYLGPKRLDRRHCLPLR